MFGDHIKKHQEFLKSQNDNTFQKGGEGSKGGMIIGHTISGKPIYKNSNESNTKDFSATDHHNAFAAHQGEMQKHSKFENGEKNKDHEHHAKMSMFHKRQASHKEVDESEKSLQDELEKAEKGKEKKTDKKVQSNKLGKTKSGKDVFADKAPEEYEDFDANDHRDAADLHHEAASKKDSGTFPGHHRAIRNQHTDEAIKGAKKKEKEALKNQPAIGDKVTTKDGIGGDIKQRDETHTYIEHQAEEDGKKKTRVSKVKNEDLDSKIASGHYTHHKPANVKKDEVKKSEDPFDVLIKGGEGSGRHKLLGSVGSNLNETRYWQHKDTKKIYHDPHPEIDNVPSKHLKEIAKDKLPESLHSKLDEGIEKSIIDELEKGHKGGGAPVGSLKQFGGREYIKAPDGQWKYHGKGTGAAAQGHAAGAHEVKTNDTSLQSENEKIAANKMSDIKQRFKAFAMFTNQVIKGKSKSMIAYGTGGVGKTYSVTRQLAQAGKRPFDAEVNAPGDDTYDYIKITGKMTAPQVYKTLYENNGKIIVFDDCDSVLKDGSAINLFKGALDTSGDGTISYGTSAGVKTDEDEMGETSKIPKRFKFDGRVIFISNLPPDSVPQPLKSRALKVDLSMNKQQTIDRIREIATDPKTGKYTNLRFPGIDKYSHQDLSNVIDYLEKNKDHIGDLNVRTVGKMLGIKQEADEMGEGKDWESYADQELFSKSESFNYNGGLMKARQIGIESIYKSKSKTKDYKSEETTSGIHISDEQLKEGEKEFKEPKDSPTDNDGDGEADTNDGETKDEDVPKGEIKKSEIDNLFDKLIK